MKMKRNISGFAWDREDQKCIVIAPHFDDSKCTLAMWIIKKHYTYMKMRPPSEFTFFFTESPG